jgi:hypothetical protein
VRTGHRLVRDTLPTRIGRGTPTEIPAVLLARLALDRGHQGTGTGGVLLADALDRIVVATQTGAAWLVVGDALHDRRGGLLRAPRLPAHPRHTSARAEGVRDRSRDGPVVTTAPDASPAPVNRWSTASAWTMPDAFGLSARVRVVDLRRRHSTTVGRFCASSTSSAGWKGKIKGLGGRGY